MNIHFFGEIKNHDLDEYYEEKIDFQGNEIEIDLHFDSNEISKELLINSDTFLKNLETHYRVVHETLEKDYKLNEKSLAVREYLEHHLSEINKEDIQKLTGKEVAEQSDLYNHLALARIGIYPEDTDEFAVFDIQLPQEFTTYVIAVTLNINHQVTAITIEN